jgi:hypothetical protein
MARRAFTRDQPVAAHNSSNITPFAFLSARWYSRAYTLVRSRLVAIDNSLTNRERTGPPPIEAAATRTPRHAIIGI